MTSSKNREWVPVGEKKSSTAILIQAFSYPDALWYGSSWAFGEFAFAANLEFVLPTEIVPPPNTFYLLAIRYDDPLTKKQVRYKLYSHKDTDIHYEQYRGQIIPRDFIIEIWCCKGHAAINLFDWEIQTGILNLQVQCCGCMIAGEKLQVGIDSNLFAELLPYGQTGMPGEQPPPSALLVFDKPFNPTP